MENSERVVVRPKTGSKAMPGIYVLVVFVCGAVLLQHYHAAAIYPYVFGFFFGYIIQRSRFCFAACFRDVFLIRNASVTRAVILSLVVATIGFSVVSLLPGHPGLESTGRIYPVGLHTVVGGVLFGLGMVIAGSCVSGCLVRIGEGYLMQWGTLAGLLAGSLLGVWHLNRLLLTGISDSFAIFLPRYLGWPAALSLQLLLLGSLFLLTKRIDGVGNVISPFRSAVGDKTHWNYGTGGVLLGLANTGLYALWGRPWGITSGMTHLVGWVADRNGLSVTQWQFFAKRTMVVESYDSLFLNHPLIYLSLSMVLGSLFSSLTFREFRIRRPRTRKYYYFAIAGGLMMGYGSRLVLGCNVGAFFSGISSLSLHGWVFAGALFFGAFLGGKVLIRYIIN